MAAVMTETTNVRGVVPAEVPAALGIWGTWRPRSRGPAGYPTQSPIVRAIEYGKLGISEPSTRPDDQAPAVVENMERIVMGSPDVIKNTLIINYRDCFDGLGNEFSAEKKAGLLGVSVSTARNRLEAAHWYVFAKMYP